MSYITRCTDDIIDAARAVECAALELRRKERQTLPRKPIPIARFGDLHRLREGFGAHSNDVISHLNNMAYALEPLSVDQRPSILSRIKETNDRIDTTFARFPDVAVMIAWTGFLGGAALATLATWIF